MNESREEKTAGAIATLQGLHEHYRHKESLEHSILIAGTTLLGAVLFSFLQHPEMINGANNSLLTVPRVVAGILIFVCLLAYWIYMIQRSQRRAEMMITSLRKKLLGDYYEEPKVKKRPYWSFFVYVIFLGLMVSAIGVVAQWAANSQIPKPH